jgi:Ca-activated chloride channel family protein
MFSNLSFEYPYVFVLLALFLMASLFFKAKTPTYYFPHLKLLNRSHSKLNLLIPFLKIIAIVCAVIALASPIKTSQVQNIKKEGINMVLSLDTSGSMRAIGFNHNNIEQNRWQAVSSIVQDFIIQRSNDNIALVVFGTSVMTASPLSFDKEAQKEIVNYLDIGVVGDKTAMIDSLAASINILKEQKSTSNIIIVLTDGEDTISQIPLNVIIRMAQKYNIKIYTIGIGESNQIMLDHISSQTNAKSFKANSKDDLKRVYDTIETLEKSKIDSNRIILKEYFFFYYLFASILALIGYIFLINKE